MKEEIQKCIKVLNDGGIILYPTDTLWGIGCDATNEEAVKRVYKFKQREDSKNMIVLVANDGMLEKYVKEVPELTWDIIDIAEKPTTIIYENGKNLAKNVLAENGSIAIRLIKEGFAHQLAYNFRKPIVSTSANISETPTPLSFDEVSNEIKEHVDFIVDSKFDTGNKQPSSILKLGIKGDVEIIRN